MRTVLFGARGRDRYLEEKDSYVSIFPWKLDWAETRITSTYKLVRSVGIDLAVNRFGGLMGNNPDLFVGSAGTDP